MKIKLTDNFNDVVVKMSEGNPGAVTALMEIMLKTQEIDPDSVMEWLGPVSLLDSYEIYGSEIYIIWNDICERNTRDFLMLLRAVQLGIIDITEITNQIKFGKEHKFFEERFTEINDKVCEKLPKFKKMEA